MYAKAAVVVVLAALWAPAAARATTYCVRHTDPCPAGQVSEPSVQAALDAATADLPGPNTVRIGPGTFDGLSAGFHYDGDGAPAVAVVGAGPDLTTLTASADTDAVMILDTPGSTISGLTVALTGNANAGLVLGSGSEADDTPIVGTGDLTNGVGLSLDGAGTYSGAAITMPDSSFADVQQRSGSGGTVRHAALTGRVGITTAPAAGVSIDGSDLTISATTDGAVAERGASVSIEESLAILRGDGAIGLDAVDGTASVEGLTLIGAAAATTGAAVVNTIPAGAQVTVQGSIFSGVSTAFDRTVQASGTAANLTAEYDDLHLGPDSGAPGTVEIDHDLDVDPRFVSPTTGDYHLLAGSPAIDAGGPCDDACHRAPDLDGRDLPIDGDGDGNAVRDMGAYEYGRTAPIVDLRGPLTIQTGDAATFDASGSYDLDPGDTLSFAWSFDDGATATGPVASHAFTTPGRHLVTVYVTDSAGVQSFWRTGIVVTSPPLHSSSGPRDRGPSVGGLRFNPARFFVATTARHSLGGTRLRLRLSDAGTVTLAIERRLPGRVTGGHCRATTSRLGRPCTVTESAGTVTLAGEPMGTVSLVFTGRIGSHALSTGSYAATAILTDATGRRSAPAVASFTVIAAPHISARRRHRR